MRKKIKLIFTTIFLTAVLIASIIEIGKVLNISESKIEYSEIRENTATAEAPSSFTAGSLGGANTSHMYLFIHDHKHYCGGHGWGLTLRKYYSENGDPVPDKVGEHIRKEEVTFKLEKTVEMAQSIAYGMKFGASDEELQNIVWAVKPWTAYTGGANCLIEPSDKVVLSTSSGGIQGRATQFANFTYRALSGRKIKFNINSNKRR